jgi:hypothetical protein
MVIYIIVYIETFELIQCCGVGGIPRDALLPIHRNQVYPAYDGIKVNNGDNPPLVIG